MIKKLAILCFTLCIGTAVYAQKKLVKDLSHVFSAKTHSLASMRMERKLARVTLSTQPDKQSTKQVAPCRSSCEKIFPPPTYHTKQFAHMEKIVQHSIEPKPFGQLRLVRYTRGKEGFQQYQKVMKTLLAFKQEADPLLYYQTREPRPLEAEEKRQWLERILDIKRQLASLRGIVSVGEESLQEAYTYLNAVLVVVAPNMAPFVFPQPGQKRADRVYRSEEFFLHPPVLSAFERILRWAGINTGSVKPLPKDLKIAVFNDNCCYLNLLEQWKQKGKLFPGNSVLLFKDAYELLHLILRGTIVPDVIITDVVAGGTDGVTLTQELRSAGYNGIIIAFTGYQETELGGKLFMEYGFDGAISNPSLMFTPATRTHLHHALQYYFYYRDLYGWVR